MQGGEGDDPLRVASLEEIVGFWFSVFAFFGFLSLELSIELLFSIAPPVPQAN
jgi:hypothetical protein